jgi:dihydroorotate dehydrogenase electron transfer subunit
VSGVLKDQSATRVQGRPAEPALARPFKPQIVAELADVTANEPVNAEYRHLVVACSETAASGAPGQFFQLLCPQPSGEQPYLRRPMSIYGTSVADRKLEFLYKVTGAGTRGLDMLRAGDKLDIMGPLGKGFHLDPAWRHLVAVGRGAGLATLAPLAKVARQQGVNVTAVFSARRPDLVVSVDLFRSQGAEVIVVTDSESSSGPANVERILRGLIAERRCDAFFTCGSSRLLQVQQRLGHALGIPGQVAMEQQMACGLGMCFCCVRDFNVKGQIISRRVCSDGPVFDLLEALP